MADQSAITPPRWHSAPADPLLEARLLSCIVKDRPHYLARCSGLEQDGFVYHEHRRLYVELHAPRLSSWAADLVGRLDPLEPTALRFLDYKDTIFRHWVRRRFRAALAVADEAALSPATDSAKLIRLAQEATEILRSENLHDPTHVLSQKTELP